MYSKRYTLGACAALATAGGLLAFTACGSTETHSSAPTQQELFSTWQNSARPAFDAMANPDSSGSCMLDQSNLDALKRAGEPGIDNSEYDVALAEWQNVVNDECDPNTPQWQVDADGQALLNAVSNWEKQVQLVVPNPTF